MIPKVIYQTWYKKDLPENIKRLNDNMLCLNKDYKYFLFDDNDIELFIKENYNSDILKAFNMLNVGAAKADLWRYLILYKNGGIYLDLDSEIYSNLDDLIKDEDEAIISRERNYNLFVQWCLIFSSNHPLLKICIDKCVDNILNKKTNNILKLTGPHVYSESIFEYIKVLNKNIYDEKDLIINKLINENNLNIRVYDYDYKNFFNFKHNFYGDLERVAVNDNQPRHWIDEKNIFK